MPLCTGMGSIGGLAWIRESGLILSASNDDKCCYIVPGFVNTMSS